MAFGALRSVSLRCDQCQIAAASPVCAWNNSSELAAIGRLEHHAHVMQSGDERRAVHLSAARRSVAEADDVGATLPQARIEGKSLRVVNERHEPGLAIAVVTHEDGELTAGSQDMSKVAEDRAVAFEERVERRRP